MKFMSALVLSLVAATNVAVASPYHPHPSSAGIAHPHHYHYGRPDTTKEERQHRRTQTHHYGNPNSRNPHQEGYQQQLGNTTNGPRY
jgi:hypothetical protein